MASAKKISEKRKMALAALKLASNFSWQNLTVQKVAKTAKIPLNKAQKLFPKVEYLVPEIVKIIDDESAKAISKIDKKSSPYDIIFESFMSRYDALQPHRSSILSISDACRKSPQMAKLLLLAQWESISNIQKLARIERHGIHGIIQTTALLAAYHSTLRCWANDDSVDLSKTMSKLNKTLALGQKIVNLFPKQD